MRHSLLRLTGAIFLISAAITGCSSSSDNDKEAKIVVRTTALNLGSGKMPAKAQINITPADYQLALVNFWLIKDDQTEVPVISGTEADPQVIDFTSETLTQDLLELTTLESGTYTGYKLQFLYISMNLPAQFHVPDFVDETDLPEGTTLTDFDNVNLDLQFRLYFNAISKYWKRDFVVELVPDSDQWYWLRRAVEDTDDYDNFFISVAKNDHPPGGAGPDNIIDLFHDDEFWGLEADYDDTSNPIIVESGSTVGGLNAAIAAEFTIPGEITTTYTITIECDIQGVMNFEDDPTGIDPAIEDELEAGVLDLGPDADGNKYGDYGLHPFLPAFNVVVTSE